MSDREYRKTGFYAAKRALSEYGSRTIDGRSKVGRALAEWSSAIVQDLGGEEAISAQQMALLELAVRTKLLLDGLDAWLLGQGREPIDKKKRRLWPIVRERMALSDSLSRYLQALGLERRTPPPEDLTTYLDSKHDETAGDDD
jgi:hypothetical protein